MHGPFTVRVGSNILQNALVWVQASSDRFSEALTAFVDGARSMVRGASN